MASDAPLRILCLDGGGVRGLSSLHILKQLMEQIRRKEEETGRNSNKSLKPCDYFDLICGSGTGGLSAIMLGRLKYDIDTAIKKYITLTEAVFGSTYADPRALFDHKILEKEMRKVIAAAPDGSEEEAKFEDSSAVLDRKSCRTFILATRPEGSGNAAVRMRTYAGRDNDAFEAKIWEVARATSAASTYFLPIDIDGIRYGDGRIGWNNPTSEAIKEASYLWPSRSIKFLISVGTGLEDANQLPLEQLDSTLGGFFSTVLRNFPSLGPRQAFDLGVAQYCINCATGCEKVHQEVSEDWTRIESKGKYVRLNVPQGMAKIGPQEWEKFAMIAALTADYMGTADIRELKEQIAELLNSRRTYQNSAQRSASGSESEPSGFRRNGIVQRQIEARGNADHRGGAVTRNPAITSNFLQGTHNQVVRSGPLMRQPLFVTSGTSQFPGRNIWQPEVSSDESGWPRSSKRNDSDLQMDLNAQNNTVQRGDIHSSTTMDSQRPALSLFSLPSIPGTAQSRYLRTAQSEDDDTFKMEFDDEGNFETTVRCDYQQCRSMRSLRRELLKEHYVAFHNETFIKPLDVMPHTSSRINPRSMRCTGCLRRLTIANQGRTCDYCQQAQTSARLFGSDSLSDVTSSSQGSRAQKSQFDFGDMTRSVATQLSISNPDDPNSSGYNSTFAESTNSSSRNLETGGPLDPAPWVPPDIPSHWTANTPTTPRRMNSRLTHSRAKSLSSNKSSQNESSSGKPAKKSQRRRKKPQQEA